MTPELDQLLLTLSKGFNLTSQEIADTLWLTLKRLENFDNFEDIPRSSKPNPAPVEPNPKIAKTDNSSDTVKETTKTDNSSGTVEEKTAGIYPNTRPINRQIASDDGFTSLRVPDAPSLREPLTLLRALRPLMRRVPSPTEEIIDEVATVNTIADNGVFLPVMQPILEPWLGLTLVVDESISMVIWRHTISELKRLFEHYGIFRDVSTWAIATDQSGKPRLRRNIGVTAQEMNFAGDRELIDPSGGSLIVVISDCVSDIWRNGEALRLLQMWTQSVPLAILQMLPERMWQRTGLALGSMVRLTGISPGVPNRELVITKQLIWDDIKFETAIKVPVFSLERELVKKWSSMVAAQGSIEAVGFIFSPDTEAILDSEEVAESPTLNPQERVQNFHLSSSPLGVRLAILLAAAPVINLPIVRLIQNTLLPDSDQVQVAEVFLGGLLKPLTPIDAKTNPDEVQYDFISEEIRNILLANAARSQAANVFQKVSEYIAAQLGRSLTEFVALLKAPNQGEDIQSFASVSTQILKKLGGEYAKFAEEVEAVNNTKIRHLLWQEGQTKIYTLCTDQPWTIPFDVFVIPSDNHGSLRGGLAASFIDFIGEENTQALEESRRLALRRGKIVFVSPNSPLIFPLPVSVKQLLHPTDSQQECFMIFATVESPYPSVENAAVAVEAIITLIVEHGLKRVVLSLLGTGANQLPKEAVAEAMLTQIKEVLERLHSDSVEEITLVDRSESTTDIIKKIAEEILEREKSSNIAPKDIRRFYQACNPANALNMSKPMDAQYYMDFSTVRGGQIIRKMEKNIWNEQDRPTCQLFTGHIGCGKSTELHKLEDNLKKKDYHVVYFEAKHDLDMSDVDITDILLAIARQVSASLEDSYKQYKIELGKYNQLLEGIGEFLSVEFIAGAEIDIPTILGKIKLTTKATPGVRTRLRQYLEPQTPNVLAFLNEQILGEANKFLKEQGKQGLVVIVDDLERLDDRPRNNSNRSNLKYIFVDRGEQLSRINCHVIYTIPLVLMYSEPQALSQKFGGQFARILPMVPVTTREGKDHVEGLGLLRQMLMKRAFPDPALTDQQRLYLIPEVFDSLETLDRLCRVNGGHLRNTLAMLQSCLNEGDPPLSRKSLEKVIRDYRDSLLTAITPEDVTLLRKVKQQQDVSGVKEQQTLFRTLFRTLLVYEYHDEEGKWYEINPMLLESETFRDRLAQ